MKAEQAANTESQLRLAPQSEASTLEVDFNTMNTDFQGRYFDFGMLAEEQSIRTTNLFGDIKYWPGTFEEIVPSDVFSNFQSLQAGSSSAMDMPLFGSSPFSYGPQSSIEGHSLAMGTIASHPSSSTWNTYGMSPLPNSLYMVRSTSYSMYSPASTGQKSQVGPRLAGWSQPKQKQWLYRLRKEQCSKGGI